MSVVLCQVQFVCTLLMSFSQDRPTLQDPEARQLLSVPCKWNRSVPGTNQVYQLLVCFPSILLRPRNQLVRGLHSERLSLRVHSSVLHCRPLWFTTILLRNRPEPPLYCLPPPSRPPTLYVFPSLFLKLTLILLEQYETKNCHAEPYGTYDRSQRDYAWSKRQQWAPKKFGSLA